MELFWKMVKLEKGNIAVILLSVPAAAVLGMIISGAVCFYDEEVVSCLPLGLIMAMCAAGILQSVITVGAFYGAFNIAVGMGVTRRRFVLTWQGITLACMAVLFVGLFLIYLVEKALMGNAFPALAFIDIGVVFRLQYLIPVAVGLWVLEFFSEALFLRFGTKMLWAVWAVWMALTLGLPRLPARLLVAIRDCFVSAQGRVLLGIIGAALAVVFSVTAWRLLRKQRVTA